MNERLCRVDLEHERRQFDNEQYGNRYSLEILLARAQLEQLELLREIHAALAHPRVTVELRTPEEIYDASTADARKPTCEHVNAVDPIHRIINPWCWKCQADMPVPDVSYEDYVMGRPPSGTDPLAPPEPLEWAKDGEPVCGMIPNPKDPSLHCVLVPGHKGPCEDGIPF